MLFFCHLLHCMAGFMSDLSVTGPGFEVSDQSDKLHLSNMSVLDPVQNVQQISP